MAKFSMREQTCPGSGIPPESRFQLSIRSGHVFGREAEECTRGRVRSPEIALALNSQRAVAQKG